MGETVHVVCRHVFDDCIVRCTRSHGHFDGAADVWDCPFVTAAVRWGQQASFDQLFRGFEYFGESLIAMLIYIGISILGTIPIVIVFLIAFFAIMAASQQNDSAFLLLLPTYAMYFLALVFWSSIVYVPFTYAFELIVDRKMKGLDACKASWTLAKPQFGKLFRLYFLYSGLGMLCGMCCLIPVFFFAPLAMGATHTLYEDYCGIKGRPR